MIYFPGRKIQRLRAYINNINLSGEGVWFARITGKVGEYVIGKSSIFTLLNARLCSNTSPNE
jgi:hypothetical protein